MLHSQVALLIGKLSAHFRHLDVSCIVTQQSPYPGGPFYVDMAMNMTHQVELKQLLTSDVLINTNVVLIAGHFQKQRILSAGDSL